MYRAASSLKRLIDAFSFLPARKYSARWEISQEEASTLFRYVAYIISGLIVYALYFPFLKSFHFAISGIVLIVILIGILFLALRIVSVFFSQFLKRIS
jgi:VIT1/CCC1 family predicted Fe2+/Mn2+ transporter